MAAYAPISGIAIVAFLGLGIEDVKLQNSLFFTAMAGFAGLIAVTFSTKTERRQNIRYLAAWIPALVASSVLYTLVNGRGQ
jgi:hypothetical protein